MLPRSGGRAGPRCCNVVKETVIQSNWRLKAKRKRKRNHFLLVVSCAESFDALSAYESNRLAITTFVMVGPSHRYVIKHSSTILLGTMTGLPVAVRLPWSTGSGHTSPGPIYLRLKSSHERCPFARRCCFSSSVSSPPLSLDQQSLGNHPEKLLFLPPSRRGTPGEFAPHGVACLRLLDIVRRRIQQRDPCGWYGHLRVSIICALFRSRSAPFPDRIHLYDVAQDPQRNACTTLEPQTALSLAW